ncbi:MAG: AraC family transcriptional regulator, partial [Actinomycetota bacterium]|nr:AraC family transcriptional regulator [Actinomycetota bacterium]
ARLAAELGYCDQAHLIRAFKAAIGVTPADYYRRSVDGS